ncbi:MAG: biopolymer transporter ExbD [Alphaproteobacteria bacterium]|nr:biopolymer transporter ExbD [Alphaproteobacteria bacterium]
MASLLQNSSYNRRQSRRRADVNITNLMDVMMVLLVVFMVAAPLMTSGIQLNLPKVGGKQLTGNETSINISVDQEGNYYIGKNIVPDDEILAKIEAIKGENSELSVTISGDTNVVYGRVIGLMALLKEAGYQRVGLKTESRVSAIPAKDKKK